MGVGTTPPSQSHPALTMVVTMLALIVAGCVYFVAASYLHFWPYALQDGLACTAEAKMCPDGTAVGRTGPNCEFAACPAGVSYRNTTYGFSVALPVSWKGYNVVTDTVDLYSVIGTVAPGGESIAQIPLVSIMHPLATDDSPRQDIPVLVFTNEQWACIRDQKCSVGAAPVPPLELAKNSRYVFALPARYNYAFPEGFEEVERILQQKPITTF